MRYVLLILVLVVAGCGKAPQAAVAPSLTPDQSLAFENLYNSGREMREIIVNLQASGAGNDLDQRDMQNHIRTLDKWIRDFERAQDARDVAAMGRRSQELDAIYAEIKKRDLVGGVR